VGSSDRQSGAFTKFEALLLQNAVGAMLPKTTPGFFGGTGPGDIWRSWLSNAVADEMARAGGIGMTSMFASQYGETGPGSASDKAGGGQVPAVGSPVQLAGQSFLERLYELFADIFDGGDEPGGRSDFPAPDQDRL